MKFGLHHSSWLDSPDPAEAYEAVKAKAQWAEEHGCVWFSVMDHMIQIPRVGTPDEPVLEGWTVLAGLAAVTSRIRLATLCTAVGYRNPAHLAKIAASVDLIRRGRLTLGIGAGFFEGEYRQYGWEFPPRPATRWPTPAIWSAATLRRYGTSWPCCADIATRRDATTTRSKRPMSSAGYLPATRPRWRQTRAAGCPWSVARLRRHRVRGHRSDRAIPGRRRRPAHP